jgi:tRNA(Ile)-lysidine synthase TilS/MesJ
MKDIFGNGIPTKPKEIIDNTPLLPCGDTVLLAFSGGNDSRTLAHVAKQLRLPYRIELAAIDTGLAMDGWRQSVLDFSEWIGLPVSFWTGEGRDYYGGYVEEFGWPGNAQHSQIQNRLKGRAYRKMMLAHRSDTEAKMKAEGVSLWILSGIRKFESRKRQLLKSPYSYREGVQFINPLFYWTNAQVADYMIDHNIPESPGTQWDCKCGATVKNAVEELADIHKHSPCLRVYLESLDSPSPWTWGEFDATAHKIQQQVEAGQMWLDDGSLESFPTCVTCVRDLIANDEAALSEW